MRTRATWTLAVGAVAALGFGLGFAAWRAWRTSGRTEAADAFSALAVCLAGGPGRVAPAEAPRYARRLHRHEDPTLVACKPYRDALLASRYVVHELPALHELLDERLDLAPSAADKQRRMWPELADIWREGTSLPWRPPAQLTGGARVAPAPVALLDGAILAARAGAPTLGGAQIDTDHDPQSAERVLFRTGAKLDFAVVGDGGRPLARVVTTNAEPRVEPWRAGATLVDDFALWIEHGRLHVRQRGEGATEAVADVPGAEALWFEQTCRNRRGRVIAVEHGAGPRTLALFEWHDGVLDGLGDVDHAGSWSLGCADGVARVAWAVPEPMPLPQDAPDTVFGWDGRPPAGGTQHVIVATCSKQGCTRADARIDASDAPWRSVDTSGFATTAFERWYGDSSGTWHMMPMNVYALGKRVLVVWEGRDAIYYRFAPIDALARAEVGWISELSRPGAGGSFDTKDPLFLEWPRETVVVRDGVALVSVREAHVPLGEAAAPDSMQLLVRFDDDGTTTALPMPAR